MSANSSQEPKSSLCVVEARQFQIYPKPGSIFLNCMRISEDRDNTQQPQQSEEIEQPVDITGSLALLGDRKIQSVRLKNGQESDSFTDFSVWRSAAVFEHHGSQTTSHSMMVVLKSAQLQVASTAGLPSVVVKKIFLQQNGSEAYVTSGTYDMNITQAADPANVQGSLDRMWLNLTRTTDDGRFTDFNGFVQVRSHVATIPGPPMTECGWLALEPHTTGTYLFGLANVHVCGNGTSTLHLYKTTGSPTAQDGVHVVPGGP